MRTELVPADAAALDRAARLLSEGQIVAFPTETVYGLGADAGDDRAVKKIFEAKGRPRHNPMIVHVPDLKSAEPLVDLDDRARRLAQRFWPGPLTLVLRARPDARLSPSVRAGLPTVAIRAPAHPVAQALLARFSLPIAAPSANRSGRISPTLGAHVLAQMRGQIPLILDGGLSVVGLESTVLDLSTPQATLLRPGGITRGQLQQVIGEVQISQGDPHQPSAPGQLLRHYAPSVPVHADAQGCAPGEGWLGFGGQPAPPEAALSLDLSPRGDLREAAQNLYRMLQQLDEAGVRAIAIAPIPAQGIGVALNDRIHRAAAATRHPHAHEEPPTG